MRTICTLLVLGLLTMAVPATAYADDAPATKITIQVKDQDVIHVIQTIAKLGKANVIVSPKIKGTLTLHLKDVSWRDALRVVVESVGGQLIEERFGIFRVVPTSEVAKTHVGWIKTRGGLELTAEEQARQELERLLVDSKKRADELRAKLELQRGRLRVSAEETAASEAKARAIKADKAKLLAALAAARKRGTLEVEPGVQLYTDLVRKDDGKGGQQLKVKLKTGPKVQTVQVYDVRDLETLNGKPIEIVKIIRGVMKGDGYLGTKPGLLIVRGGQEVHERVNRVLAKLRSAQQPNAVIGLGGGAGIKPWPRFKKKGGDRSFKDKRFVYLKKAAEAAMAQKKAAQPYVISLGTSDGVVARRKAKGDYVARRKAGAHLGAIPFAAERKRIENLQRAAGYLHAAGDSSGATRVRAQAAAALGRLRQHEAQAKSGAAHGEVRGSIDGLRHEVRALRGEVRALTALVRRLLQQQEK